MSPEHPHSEPDLVGYHLGLLDDEEAAGVALQLTRSIELQQQHAALVETLQPLDALTVEPAGRALVESVLARVARAPRLVKSSRERGPLLRGEDAPRAAPKVSLRELVGLAAAIALFVSVFLPGFQHARRQAERQVCADNLSGLGRAHASYAAAFSDTFPFAGAQAERWAVTTAEPGVTAVGNSRNVYLLLRFGFATPNQFLCPARPDASMPADQVRRATDFADMRNISFASPLRSDALRTQIADPAYPLLSDPSSEFDGRRIHHGNIWNSNSHGHGAGQNVLRSDGGVVWAARSDIGPQGDDIFKIADQTDYKGDERPQSPTDMFLVP